MADLNRLRFSIRWQISLCSLMLVAIPFLGWSYWQDVRDTVLSAQSRIQESEARVIATTPRNGVPRRTISERAGRTISSIVRWATSAVTTGAGE